MDLRSVFSSFMKNTDMFVCCDDDKLFPPHMILSFTCPPTQAGQFQVAYLRETVRHREWSIHPPAWLCMWSITLLIHPGAPENCTAPIKLLHCDSQCEEETCIIASTIFHFLTVILMKQTASLSLLQFQGSSSESSTAEWRWGPQHHLVSTDVWGCTNTRPGWHKGDKLDPISASGL